MILRIRICSYITILALKEELSQVEIEDHWRVMFHLRDVGYHAAVSLTQADVDQFKSWGFSASVLQSLALLQGVVVEVREEETRFLYPMLVPWKQVLDERATLFEGHRPYR